MWVTGSFHLTGEWVKLQMLPLPYKMNLDSFCVMIIRKAGRHSELENFLIASCVTLTQVSPPNRKPGKWVTVNFMFCWPCISIHPCNENQLDALFILSLFRHSTSTCFGHIGSPSSGGILYIYSIPPDDGLSICPKHVEVEWRSKLRINGASSWFSLHGVTVTC